MQQADIKILREIYKIYVGERKDRGRENVRKFDLSSTIARVYLEPYKTNIYLPRFLMQIAWLSVTWFSRELCYASRYWGS